MITPKHDWLYRIEDLPEPPLLQRETHENIKQAIEEIQEHAVTNARCVDDSLDVWVEKGEVLVAAFGTGEVKRLNATLTGLCKLPVWNAPVLSYTPVSIVIQDGMIQSIEEQASVTIDTAEAC